MFELTREDFATDCAWCHYKFNRESQIEQIQALKNRLKEAEKDRNWYRKWFWIFGAMVIVYFGGMLIQRLMCS